MDKIKQLMIKVGLSEEAANQLTASIDNHLQQLRESVDKEYQQKLEKAKQICLKETEDHKRELSRRLQIFLEAKSNHIQEVLGKQSAERGTEAESKLEKIASLVEGIEINGQPNSDLQAQNAKLIESTNKLQAQYKKAITKANQLQEVINTVLKRNKKLEQSLAESQQKQLVSESTNLNQYKTKSKAATTRRTLEENVTRKTPEKRATNPIEQIAETID